MLCRGSLLLKAGTTCTCGHDFFEILCDDFAFALHFVCPFCISEPVTGHAVAEQNSPLTRAHVISCAEVLWLLCQQSDILARAVVHTPLL